MISEVYVFNLNGKSIVLSNTILDCYNRAKEFLSKCNYADILPTYNTIARNIDKSGHFSQDGEVSPLESSVGIPYFLMFSKVSA